MTVDLEAIEAALAAATPRPWWAGVDGPDDDGYWATNEVHAFTMVPPPFNTIPYSEEDDGAGEARCEEISEWADSGNYRGTVCQTHNYIPITDEQHDANQRLIAHGPDWLADLIEEVKRLRGQLEDANITIRTLVGQPPHG